MDEIIIKLSIDGTTGNVSLQATDKNLQKLVQSVNDASKATNTFSDNFVKSFQNMRNLGQGFEQAMGMMKNVFGEGIKKAEEYEVVMAKIKGIIASNGQAAGYSAEQIEKMAMGYAKSTMFARTDILTAEQILLTYSNIGHNVFPQAAEAAMGLANVMEVDMKKAATLLGATLDHPIEGMGMLMKLRITLSKEEKDHITTIQQTGNAEAAQALILDILAKRYSEVNTEMQKTDAFKINQAQKAFADLQRQAGELELLTAGPMLAGLNNLFNVFGKLPQGVKQVTVAAGELGIAFMLLNSTGIGKSILGAMQLGGSLNSLRANAAIAKIGLGELTAAEYEVSVAAVDAAAANKGFLASMGLVGWSIIAVTALVAAWGLLDNTVDKTTETMGEEEKKLKGQQLEFNRLAEIIRNTAKSETERGKAIQEISSKYPEYINQSELENASQKRKNELLARGNDLFEQRLKINSQNKLMQEASDKLVAAQTERALLKKAEDKKKTEKPAPITSEEQALIQGEVARPGEDKLKDANDKVDKLQKEYDGLHEIIIGQPNLEKPDVTAKNLLEQSTKTAGWTGKAVDDLVKELQDVLPNLVKGGELWKKVKLTIDKLGKDDIGVDKGTGTKPMLDEAKLNLQNVTEISGLYSSIEETWNKIDKSQAKDSKGLVDSKKTDQERLQGKYKIREDLEKEIDALMKSKTKTAEVTAESKGEDKVQTLQDKLQAMQSVIAEVDRQSKIWDDKGRSNFPVISEQKKTEWGNEAKKIENDIAKEKFDAGAKDLNYDEEMISKRMEIENAGDMEKLLLKESYLQKELQLAEYYHQSEKAEELKQKLDMLELDKQEAAKKMLQRSRDFQYEMQISKANRTKNEYGAETLGEFANYEGQQKKIEQDPLLTQKQKDAAQIELTYATQQRMHDIKLKYYDQWLGELAGLSQQEIEAISQTFSQIENAANSLMSLQSKQGQATADNYRNSQYAQLDIQKTTALSMARTDQQKAKVEADYALKKQKIDDDANAKGQEKIKAMFIMQKALSITNATISTFEAAASALKNPLYPSPLNFILAAATIAAGLANVAVISSQPMPKFALGGMPAGITGMMFRPSGLINGPGSGTSDSIAAWISNKEFVVNADATARHRLLLENINANKYAAGGYAGGLSYSSSHISNFDPGTLQELKALRDDLKSLGKDLTNMMNTMDAKTSQPVAIGDDACRRITSRGIGRMRKLVQ